MPIDNRIRNKFQSPGPYIGRITNLLDPTYMGSLEVVIEKGFVGDENIQSQTYTVQYLSPFYGVTGVQFEGTDPRSFNDVQKSYGFWMVPPDIGTRVLVLFIDGDANQGYWIGCVPDKFQNHMVPGIAASQNVYMTPEDELKYGTKLLPVAEFSKRSSTPQKLLSPNSQQKPIHPFADRLLAQGLLLDNIRGVTSSTPRREIPSMVFGISTPGPIDPNGKKGRIGYEQKRDVPVSRLGGTQFVMDDGDDNGQNELVRIRTRTGHQILLHNSSDLIYIANSKGTAWIELTSNGKIDVYAQDSISLHTEVDFNFRADRDVNIEAGRNVNVKANKAMDVNVLDHFFMIVNNDAKLNFSKNVDKTIALDFKSTVGENFHLNVGKEVFQTSGSNFHIKSGSNNNFTANSNTNILSSGNHIEQAAQIHMNGPTPTAASTASTADIPSYLPVYNVPARNVGAGWANGQFYKIEDMPTILQRVPMHEPWDQHENININLFSPDYTDITIAKRPDVEGTAAVSIAANDQASVPGTCSSQSSQEIGAASAQAGIKALKDACKKAGITSPYAVASVLAIAGGESRWVPQEEGAYYTEERLKTVFRTISDSDAKKYARWKGPKSEFFEFFYGGTGSGLRPAGFLGNTAAGDGGKFYGRGYIQLTGKGNYQKYSKLAFPDEPDKLINNPSLVNDPAIGADVAVAYFKDRVKVSQDDPNYISAALTAVGYNVPDIYAKKMGYYQCFLSQLKPV